MRRTLSNRSTFDPTSPQPISVGEERLGEPHNKRAPVGTNKGKSLIMNLWIKQIDMDWFRAKNAIPSILASHQYFLLKTKFSRIMCQHFSYYVDPIVGGGSGSPVTDVRKELTRGSMSQICLYLANDLDLPSPYLLLHLSHTLPGKSSLFFQRWLRLNYWFNIVNSSIWMLATPVFVSGIWRRKSGLGTC